jgi:hypothetical protein
LHSRKIIIAIQAIPITHGSSIAGRRHPTALFLAPIVGGSVLRILSDKDSLRSLAIFSSPRIAASARPKLYPTEMHDNRPTHPIVTTGHMLAFHKNPMAVNSNP